MSVLAIVGSVSLAGREDVYQIIQREIEERAPALVVSGGAAGVDTMAAEVAAMMGIPVREHLPQGKGWKWYAARNLKIAQDCHQLVRIVAADSRTYGSGWTRDRAAALGAIVKEHRVAPSLSKGSQNE